MTPSKERLHVIENQPTIIRPTLICIENGLVLMTVEKGQLRLPGGKVDEGETPQSALEREIKEELDTTINMPTLTEYGMVQRRIDNPITMLLYRGKLHGEPHPDPTSDVPAIRWTSYAEREACAPLEQEVFERLHSDGLLAPQYKLPV